MRVVHLGLGNFHRAHQAVYTQDAGDGWSITGVAHRSHDVVEALSRQDHRYSLVVIDGDEVEVRRIEAVTEGLVLAAQPEAVVARIADPQTAVVTLTITEKGYALRPDGSLDTTSPDVAADLVGDAPPRSALGALCRGLQDRARAAGEPLTVVSCDNLAGNGPLLAGAVREYVAAAGSAPDVTAWIDAHVGFPATMVDRIVPATTAQTLELARAAGFADAVPVPAERFSQWVLQPDFRGPRPAWEAAGAVFTDDVAAWETVKVRLLNGVHSLLAYLGLLRGDRLIAEAHSDAGIRAAAAALGDEYVPTLRVPDGLDVATYRAALARRFDNAALGHRCAQVATDGSLKLAQRVPVAAAWHLDRGHVPHTLALLVAAWLECLSDPGAVAPADRPRDPAASRLALLAASAPEPADLARVVLHDEALLGEPLGGYGGFVDRVGELLGVLRRHGPDTAAHEAVAAS